MALKYFRRNPKDTKPAPDLSTTLEQLAQVQQQTYAVLTTTAPEDKNSLNKVLSAVDSYEAATENFVHNFKSEPLGTDVLTHEIYGQTMTFLMNYIQHRFSTTNNPRIWLSTLFLEEYDTVHARLQ